MLTVAKVTGKFAVDYASYLEGKATPSHLGDYYLKDGERVEAPGRWVTGATAVGCDPRLPVAGEQLRALMAVRHPHTGQPLRRHGSSGEAVAALDATFSAPKSVSAVWAIASPELRAQIERAHEAAIDRALGYALEQMAMIRQRIDAKHVIHTRAVDIVASSWRHTTARAVDGQPPDPQLHSHVLLHSAVRRDGKLVAIDSRTWLVHRREIGAAYRTELARELALLRFGIERHTGRGGRYFEVQGVPAGLLDRWSSRHREVRAAIENRIAHKERELLNAIRQGGPDAKEATQRLRSLRAAGRLGASEERFMSRSTRTAKRLLTRSELDGHWSTTAAQLEFHRRSVEHVRSVNRVSPPTADISAVVGALTEFDAAFTDREARAVALEASTGVTITDALQALGQLRADGELLTLADGRLTTRTHRAMERSTVEIAQRLAHTNVTPLPAELVQLQASQLDQELAANGGALTSEQRHALQVACSDRQLVIIEGQAGTGKSTTLTAIARAHQSGGRQIILTSTAALAAQRLGNELSDAGVDVRSFSTVALQHAINTSKLELGPATTVIHDEAALASTRELQPLLQAIEQSGARLILVGDPRQSQAVGAGGLWPHLEHTSRMIGSHVELTRTVRARDPGDRRDQKRFREGEHGLALRGYAVRDRVHLHPDQARAEDRALEAAQRDRRRGMRTLVIAQTSNDHLDELNARAQAIRLEDGELGEHSLTVAGRPYRLHARDEIQIRNSIHHPEHGQLRNGTTATITTIDPDQQTVNIQLTDGRKLTLDQQQIDQASVRLAYVQHPVPAQGQTSDSTHLIVAEHATREGSYVALTRARHATHIHASEEHLDADPDRDLIAQLAEHMSREEPDLPSIATPLALEQQIVDRQQNELRARPRAPSHADTPARDNERPVRERQRVASVLGPQPSVTDTTHAAWHDAARAIVDYRTRYEIDPGEPAPLGSEPAAGLFQQRLDRKRAAARIAQALKELGLTIDGREPTAERILTSADSIERDQDRGNGWEP